MKGVESSEGSDLGSLSFELSLPGELTRKAGTHSVRAWTMLSTLGSADALMRWMVLS